MKPLNPYYQRKPDTYHLWLIFLLAVLVAISMVFVSINRDKIKPVIEFNAFFA